MHGNTLSRSSRLLGHLLTHPRDAWRYLGDRVCRGTPADRGLPWFSWSAIRELERRVTPGMKVFEWGVGGSTRFLLERGCEVTTAETSPLWAENVRGLIPTAHHARLNLRLIPETSTPDELAAMVRQSHGWDLVVVDGLASSRMDCLRAAKESLSPSGFIILDDAWRDEYAQAPQIMTGFRREVYRGNGPCRPGVTQTDFYLPQGPVREAQAT